MVTSIVSSIANIPVDREIAMTGEVTVTGQVLPIGGLKEKLLAAHRAGIKKVLIPMENKKDLVEVADALTDILYVTYGAGHAFGINLDECFEEVQNSNMSKLDNNGKPIYNEMGKVMKGENYFKPDLSKFVK